MKTANSNSFQAFKLGDSLKDAFHNLWLVVEVASHSYTLQDMSNPNKFVEVNNTNILHDFRLHKRAKA